MPVGAGKAASRCGERSTTAEQVMQNETDAQVTGRYRAYLLRIDSASDPAVLERRCTAAVRGGFDGVELAISEGAAEGWRFPENAPTLPVRAVAIRWLTLDVTATVDQLAAFLPRAATWGATSVNLTPPPVAPQGDEVGFARYQEGLNFAFQLLHGIRYEAEATGVTVAVEAARGGCLLSPVEVREIVDQANSWAVGACLDIEHIRRIGSADDWITTLGRRVLSVRAPIADTTEASRIRATLAPLLSATDSASPSAAMIAVPATGDP